MAYTHADEWMVHIEKMFKVFECIGQQNVQLVAFMFRSVAKTWWRTVEATYLPMADPFSVGGIQEDLLQEV